jgi:release factor glutamine methyltransferase
MTLLAVLQSTTDYFKKKQIENPRLNAEHLLAHSLGRKRIELYLEFERELTDAELTPLREMVRRRGQGEPLQHLLGTVEFCGLIFQCDKRALVPRPETEELVELLKSQITNQKSELLDVGTGSGVIALSLASKFPSATVHGVDISDDALGLAAQNAARLGLTDRITFSKSDLLESVNHHYDVIVANLPYVARGERETLGREVLHDPNVALFAGDQGDEMIRRLIETAPAHLKPGGLLALELGLDQAEGLAAFANAQNFHDVVTRRDFAGVVRFLFARYG